MATPPQQNFAAIEFILHDDNNNNTKIIYYNGNHYVLEKPEHTTETILTGKSKEDETKVSTLFAKILQSIEKNKYYKIALYIDNNNNNNNETIKIFYKNNIAEVPNFTGEDYTKVILDGTDNERGNVSTMFAKILPNNIQVNYNAITEKYAIEQSKNIKDEAKVSTNYFTPTDYNITKQYIQNNILLPDDKIPHFNKHVLTELVKVLNNYLTTTAVRRSSQIYTNKFLKAFDLEKKNWYNSKKNQANILITKIANAKTNDNTVISGNTTTFEITDRNLIWEIFTDNFLMNYATSLLQWAQDVATLDTGNQIWRPIQRTNDTWTKGGSTTVTKKNCKYSTHALRSTNNTTKKSKKI